MNTSKTKDQYYTHPDLVNTCVNLIKPYITNAHTILEPSAGTGNFLKALQNYNIDAYDIEPKHKAVMRANFLETHPPNKPYITIGNPPFGGHSTQLAVRFFNKCAVISDYIAFILPKSFRKQSVQNKLDLNFHIIKDIDCPKNSFLLDGVPWDVSTCFQIWEKRIDARNKIRFKGKYFTAHKEGPFEHGNFYMRFYGRNAGIVLPDNYCGSLNTVRIIKPKIPNLRKLIETLDFSEEKFNVGSMMCINALEVEQKIERILNVRTRPPH